MKSPCIAACKNIDGICSGCKRTMDEIANWRHYDDAKRQAIMDRLSGKATTHDCPTCSQPTHCDITAGKTECWCFAIETRDLTESSKHNQCQCRGCLAKLPVSL